MILIKYYSYPCVQKLGHSVIYHIMYQEKLMEIKVLSVLLVLIENAANEGYLTQKEISNQIYTKYMTNFDRKSIASAITVLETKKIREDIERLLGYKIVRGPQNKGVSVVKINESSLKKTIQ